MPLHTAELGRRNEARDHKRDRDDAQDHEETRCRPPRQVLEPDTSAALGSCLASVIPDG